LARPRRRAAAATGRSPRQAAAPLD